MTADILPFEKRLEGLEHKRTPHGGGEPPHNDGMEARVAKLETIAEKMSERLVAIDKDVGIIKTQMDSFTKHYATKADLTEAKNSIIMWVVGAVFLAQLLPGLLKKFGL
jgi:hypothetical protein